MALQDYQNEMATCARCSLCKFIPMEKIAGYRNVAICPSITHYNANAYSGGGRLAIALAMLEKKFDYNENILNIAYNCQMCGACDVSCKYVMDLEVLEPINEFRIKCIEDGHVPQALSKVINSLRKQGTMVPGSKASRANWAGKLKVKDITKEKAEVIYHAGCRTCYDRDFWGIAQANIKLMQKAKVDVGIMGNEEACCGGRAYQMGFKEDFLKQAERNMGVFEKSGAKILVTGCAECYQAFKVLYDKFGMKGKFEILHTSEFFDRLIKEGKLKPSKQVNMKVTYHDPCHLGRLGESYIHWKGIPIPGYQKRYNPPKKLRRGTFGVYEPARDILKSIPGLQLVEMERIKEYAWCCGAGGGVYEVNPDFAVWTANERITEAAETGAEAIVTACPWCVRIFKDTLQKNGRKIKIYDVVELLEKSI